MYTESREDLSTANKKEPLRCEPITRQATEEKNMTEPEQDKEQQMLKFEIENCRKNIEFYQTQIENMKERLQELEKLREAYEYY